VAASVASRAVHARGWSGCVSHSSRACLADEARVEASGSWLGGFAPTQAIPAAGAFTSPPQLNLGDCSLRELRQSFVSLLSDAQVPVEVISRLVGHRSTTVTEMVYRKQLRPVIEGGADVLDRILQAWPHPGA
jgi:hypothetical protein